MGSVVSMGVAPTSDVRVQRAMQTFDLTKADIVKFWNVFKKYDVNQRGVISMSAFYDNVIHEPRTIFGDGLFDIIESDDGETIDFGEFVAAVTTYCFFEIPEILKFVMYVFDRDKAGFVMINEFRLLIDAMHNHNVSTNVTFALDNWKYKRDGRFYFSDLVRLSEQFAGVLFPAFRMQSAMMNTVGGEKWWERRKIRLVFNREAEARKDRNHKLKIKRENERYRQAQIRRHMGTARYYLMPWERKRFYAIYPAVDSADNGLGDDDYDDDNAILTADGTKTHIENPESFDGRAFSKSDFRTP